MTSNNNIHMRIFGYKPNRGDATRLRITEAAVAIIAKEGLEDVTFERLGEVVGIGKANVRYHFEDKRDVFIAAVKLIVITAQDITIDRVAKAKSPTERLQAVIEGAFAWLRDHPDQAKVFTLFWYLSARDPSYLQLHHDVRQSGALRLAAIIQELSGKKFDDLAAFDFARSIQRMISGEILEHMTTKFENRLSERELRVKRLVVSELKSHGVQCKLK